MTETNSSAAPDASTIVAQSLSTVGYSMFSLCQSESLGEVESFSLVVQRGGTFDASTAVSIGGGDDFSDLDDVIFGVADVDENLGAVTPVAVPEPVAPFVAPVGAYEPVGASSALMALGPDGRPQGVDLSSVAEGSHTPDAVPSAPAGQAPALPDYHSNSGQSLSLLQDINFIED